LYLYIFRFLQSFFLLFLPARRTVFAVERWLAGCLAAMMSVTRRYCV